MQGAATLTEGNLLDRWADRVARSQVPTQDPVLRHAVCASPLLCAHLLLRGPPHAPFHGRVLWGDVHLAWDLIVTRERRFALMAPRGIGKSFFFSFAYPIWRMIRNHEPLGLLLGSTAPNAQRILEAIRNEIEDNSLLRWLYPTGRRTRQWNTQRITTEQGHTVLARSALSRIRGLHPDYIVGDDILTDEAKISEAYRRKTLDWWLSVVENMPVPGGQLGLCGTPMHRNDLLYDELRHNPGYSHHRFPILSERGESLWPELYPPDYVADRKRVLGNIRFTCEMMVQPVSDDTSLLPRHLFAGEPQEQMAFRLGMSQEELAPLGLKFYMGVDLAFSASSQADYFVALVLGIDAEQNRWVVEIDRGRGLSYLEQPARINTLGRRYRCQRIYVEANAAQRIIGDDLIRRTDLPIKKWTTTAKKHDLTYGLPALRLLAENRKWRIPRGDRRSVEVTDWLLDEMGSFSFQSGRVVSLGAHDDGAMACYLADQAVRAGSSFRTSAGAPPPGPRPPPGIAGQPGGNVAPPSPIRPHWPR